MFTMTAFGRPFEVENELSEADKVALIDATQPTWPAPPEA